MISCVRVAFARYGFAVTLAAALFPSALCKGAAADKASIRFNRDIRPILSDNCFACHGPDKNKRKAGLRLDNRDDAIAALDGGHSAIAPGDPSRSKLLQLITTASDDDRMPPVSTGKRLSREQVELVRRWIAEGANYEAHWAYIPPERGPLPSVRNKRWPAGDIDHFILSRLDAEGLKPAREADRVTLIRRLSFDLTGLPPSAEEVAAFVNDKSAEAFGKLVERMLASPHFGERMAANWLDLVRYADTDGFHSDNYRSVWPYRDYVIRAFNDNMPFDRFTIEQIAGDLLPNATLQQKVASTYNRLHRTTEEGGSQPKEYLAKYSADRVRTTGTAWLGGTVGCAECHDHKFDPYSTRDFYSFAAFFSDIKEVGVGKPEGSLVPDAEQEAKLKSFDQQIAAVRKTLDTMTPELDAAQATWETDVATKPLPKFGNWHAVGPFAANDFDAAFKKAFAPEKDADLAKCYNDGKLAWSEHAEWTDGQVHNTLTGENSANYLLRTVTASDAQSLELSFGSDDGIKVWINGHEVLAKKVGRPAAPDQEKAIVTLKSGENKLLVKIVNGAGPSGFYFKPLASVPENIATIVQLEPAQRSDAQKAELANYFRSVAPALQPARDELAKLNGERDAFVKTIPTTLATVAVEPREIRVLPRGNWMRDDGEVVQPAVPHFLPQPGATTNRATRLDLARWLVARDNPLTARVFVNRLWKTYFGAGLSRNLYDVGAQGEWPTHPELLDWLAVEFVESGWDVKHMVRLLVTSRTYRQSSDADEKLREKDPYNRLLARQSRWRLEAELVRDNALAVSGLLVSQIGGPSVKPYQPEGFWDQLNFPKRTYVHDNGEAQYRRGLYAFWCRTFPNPSMTAFDAPSREECTAERVVSNTPLQALALLNDPTYVEAARVLAERIVRHGGKTPAERIQWAFGQVLNRRPSSKEQRVLEDLYAAERAQFAADAEAPAKLLKVGLREKPGELDAVELAAWTSVARSLLNLHEAVTRF